MGNSDRRSAQPAPAPASGAYTGSPSKSAANRILFWLKVRRSMSLWKNYHLASTLQEALETLAAAQRDGRSASLVAGGSDLLLDLQQGRHAPVDTLVDVTIVPEMIALEIRDERLYIGASVPLNRIVADPLVCEHAQAVQEACGLIGGPQVRNTATLGGNVGHALPAADGTIALLALGALAEIASLDGRRFVSLESLFLGPGKSVLLPCQELLLGFSLPLRQPGQASVHRRVMRPQGVAIAILNMAAWLERDGERITEARLAVGPAAPTPFRARRTETVLQGQPLTAETIAAAYEALLTEARFRTSPHRATAEYRRHLAGVLLKETLTTAWSRAGE
jgi:xanthine dehydrogenase FAD-binding subunit